MKNIILIFSILLFLTITKACLLEWSQCGGKDYSGKTNCCAPTTCVVETPYFSRCTHQVNDTSSIKTKIHKKITVSDINCAASWMQCGGLSYKGIKNCCSGNICKITNQYYSQCIPASPKPGPIPIPKPGSSPISNP